MATAAEIRAIGLAIEYYRPRFDSLGIDANRVLLETLWRLDAKQTPKNKFGEKRPGIPCGKAYISWRKKCSESNSKTAAARLKGTAEGKAYANRVRKSKGLKAKTATKGAVQEQSINFPEGSRKRMMAREDVLRQNTFETAEMYNGKTGKKIATIKGDVDEVVIPTELYPRLKDCVFTHNHPLGWGYEPGDPRRKGSSFSDDDIITAAGLDMAEMRAVSVGYRHSIKRPPGGWPKVLLTVKKEIDAAENEVRAPIQEKINVLHMMGKMQELDATIADAEANHSHRVMEVFAKRIGAEYKREEIKNFDG